VINRARKELREQKNRMTVSLDEIKVDHNGTLRTITVSDPVPSAEKMYYRNEQHGALHESLDRLPESHRWVLRAS
jgi:DNA-directed RNA polymerase specialized sigma24 family protein